MSIKNLCYDYLHYTRKNEQFYKLFYLSQNLLKKDHVLSDDTLEDINLLNDRRIRTQTLIGNLFLRVSSRCKECKGKCCQKPAENYFTAIDFWLRNNTSDLIANYRMNQKRRFHLIPKRLKQLFSIIILNKRSLEFEKGDTCFYLGPNGCKLAVSDRPIKCLVFCCRQLREAMDKYTKNEFYGFMRNLFSISLQTFDVLKKEAGFPMSFGRLPLLLKF